MERIYKAANSRKNTDVRKFKVKSFGWSEETTTAWEKVKHILANTDTLRVRDVEKALVLFTDASEEGWSGILVQCPFEELGLAPSERSNQLLWCCGGRFNDTQRRWPIVELEAFAVMKSIVLMWHIIGDGSVLHVFTDSEVLAQILEAKGDYVSRKDKPGRNRIYRWMEIFFSVPLSVRHIPGELNTFADVVSRLEKFPTSGAPVNEDEPQEHTVLVSPLIARVSTVRLKYNLRTVTDKDWVQPTLSTIRLIAGEDGKQDDKLVELAGSYRNAVFDYGDRVWKVDGAVLIPDNMDLRISLIVMAHSYGAGHRGVETTIKLLEAVVVWPGMKEQTKKFVAECIHCLEKRSWLVDRPWGEQLMPRKRNQLVSFDFLDLGASEEGFTKILVVTDKLSGYTSLTKAVSESSEIAATALVSWLAKIGAPDSFFSDEGVAFKNSVIAELRGKLKIDHHFVTAHSSWANGKQERLNLTIGNIFRTILSESGLAETSWCYLVEIVEMIVNHTPVKSLNWMAPVNIMLGLEETSPLDAFLDVKTKKWQKVALNDAELEKYVADFRKEVNAREVRVHEFQEQEAIKRREEQENKPGVRTLVLERGDFVMVLDSSRSKLTPKLAKRWIGPARVVEFDKDKPHTVKVEYLCPASTRKRTEIVHARRVKFFDNADLVTTPELVAHAEYTAKKKYVVRGLLDLRRTDRKFEVLVQWDGYDGEDTWEPLARLCRDVPTLVSEFLKNGVPSGSRSLLAEVRKLAFIRKLTSSEGGSVSE